MKKLYSGLVVMLALAAITGVGYASDIRHENKKDVAELALPEISHAMPMFIDDVDFTFSPAIVDAFVMPEPFCTHYVQPNAAYKSRPGNYRYLNGLLDGIPYSKRY